MMKENSRIRFNPVTKEIEVEGSETFVKTYFDKLQAMISGAPEAVAEGPKTAKAAPAGSGKKRPKAGKTSPPKKTQRAAKNETGEKRVTHIDTIVGLIQGSAEGISTTELKEKTGLVESQIWSIVNRAAKMGKIKKMKRGLYGAV
jgi:ribosomal protein L12E/L44/L45/RPP1/RPP2